MNFNIHIDTDIQSVTDEINQWKVYIENLGDVLLDVSRFDWQNKDKNLNLILCGLEEIKNLNGQYRNKPEATDVLTFDYSEENQADIFISMDIAYEQAKQKGHRLHEELTLLAVHGMLHASGFDHEISSIEAEKMKKMEIELLKQLHLEKVNSLISA